MEFEAAVLGAPRLRLVRRRRAIRAEALARDTRLVDPVLREPFRDRSRAARTEPLLAGGVSAAVGVPFDAQLAPLGKLEHHGEQRGQPSLVLRARDELCGAGPPVDRIEELDARRAENRLRAAVPSRIDVGRTALVGAGIGVVEHAIVVAILIGATVGLGIGGRDAGCGRTGIGEIIDPVVVGVGRSSIDLDRSFRDGKEDLIAGYERRYLEALLAWAGGNVTKAARKARIDRMSLYRLMQRHDVKPNGT